MDGIFQGIDRFRREIFPRHRSDFEALGAGQSPQLLLVTCSDSRIDPSLITQAAPGEIFVIRNAGNLVAAHEAGPSGEAATIEFGIEALQIPDIAICGHTRCGAMAALREPASADGLPTVKSWLGAAQAALERVDAVQDFDDPLTRVVAANVLQQVAQLRTHPSVARAEAEGRVRLHGWVYDFEAGEIFAADADGRFRPIDGTSKGLSS